MKLKDNTILITGGSSGIGLELGRTFLKLGNTVILLGRNRAKLAELKSEGFDTIVCNLEKLEEIESASIYIQNNHPGINVLFNNAGVQFNYNFLDNIIPLNKIIREININVSGQIVLTQLLIPQLNNSKEVSIINTTSGLGAYPKDNGLVYSAGKAAMRNFTIGLRNVLRNTSINVIEFVPPVTETAMTSGRNENKMPVHELVKTILPQLAKGKKLVTVAQMRLFIWISHLFPGLAYKILSK